MVLKVFVKKGCPNCPAAKEVANQFPFSEMYDLEDPEGLAEAAFYSVFCTPSMVLVDEHDSVVEAWRCHVPRPSEIANYAA
ncbi:MAG: hypothetical protein PHO53_04230 [Actinomycetota bacterium]|nr:hypothetical protein [Actinomycetota bacterium]